MIIIDGNKYGIIKNENTEENLLAKQEEIYDFAWLMNMLGIGGFEVDSYSPGKQSRPQWTRKHNVFFCKDKDSKDKVASDLFVKFDYPDPYIVNIQIVVFEDTLNSSSFQNVTDFLRDNGYPVYVLIFNPEGSDISQPLYDFMDE